MSNTSSKATPDNVVQNELPPSGTGYDNNYINGYVDIDTDVSTFMSSSDQLNLPNCTEITWAGLYWGGEVIATNTNYSLRNKVKLKVNNGTYTDLTADYVKDNSTGFKTYHCFKDISSILKTNGLTDRYTIANVVNDIGGKNLFGGWTIVVIYKNNTQTMRNLTVFDGLANVMAGTYSTVDIPISGFQTPLSGPVTFELGLVVYDGDRSLTGDQLLFKGASTFVNLSDALHPQTDMFNSTLARNGVLTPLRNPSYNNTLGYDANIFSPNNSTKNYIGNNAISATIRQTTGGETYLTQVVTSAIDVYEPDLRSAVRVKNITHPGVTKASPGDVLEYTVNGLNIGSDPSVNTFVTDTIEGNAQFVPGSLSITYGPNIGVLSDAAGDDQGEYIASSKVVRVRIGTGANSSVGGFVNNSPTGTDSTQFKFRVKATTDCVYLACDSIINNSAFIVGTGNISGNTFNNASNPGVFDAFGCPIPGSTQTPIATNGCPNPSATSNTPVCLGGTINFTASLSASATYSWTGPNGFTSTLRQPSITNATTANSGIYTANIFITGTACHFVYPFNADINAANAGPDQIGASTCGLTSVTLAGNKPTGTSGAWSIIAGTGGSFADNTNPATTFSGTAGNSYTLRWTLNSGGCPSTNDDVLIKFNQGPTASVLSGSSSICYNGYASVKVVITGGTAPFTLTLNNGGGTFTNYTSGNDIIVGPLTSTTTFSLLSVTDASGCSSSGLSGNATITVSNAITGSGTISQLNVPVSGGGPKTDGTDGNSSVTNAWLNTNKTTLSDNTYASVGISSKGTSSAYLLLSNFGFTVPGGATIVGVEATIERYYTTTGTRTVASGRISVATISGSTATLIGSNQSFTYPVNTKLSTTVGGATNMWGGTTSTLTPAIVNNANFGVRIRMTTDNVTSNSGTATAYIDYVTLKIYYTPAASYCDNATGMGFAVSTYTNATNYTWAPPSGGTVTSGQGTASATMDFNGAGQNGNYNVCVTASNNCQTLSPSCVSIPIADCVNTGNYIMGNVYWDTDGSISPKIVDGTGIGTANATQLYVTIEAAAGTTALQNSVAVGANGTYKFSVTASTTYKIVLSKNSYTTGQTIVAALPPNCSYNGEKANNVANTLTGNDGLNDGILSVTSLATNNVVNANFGIKISTPPVAVNDITNTNEDTPVTFTVTTNDTDPDGTVTASTVDLDQGAVGIQNTLNNAYGSWSVNASGVVTYTPAANFNGNASVTYTVNDNDGNTSNIGTLLVSVSAVNDPPVAVDNAVAVTTNTTHIFSSVDFPFTDVESDAIVSITVVTLPVTGSLTLNGTSVTAGQVITAANLINLVYTPLTNGYGTPYATFTFKVNDASLGTVAALFTINIPHVNIAPLAVNDAVSTTQNIPVSLNLLTNDASVDGTLVTNSVDLDPLTPLQQTSISIPGEGTYTDNGSGTVTFTPLPAFYGTATPLSYTVNSSLGLTSNIAAFSITVIPLGAPVAVDDAASTNENATITFSVTGNDTDDGSINVSRVDLDPLTPGIQQSYYVSAKGQFVADMLGNVTFTPDWNFFGTATATYTVKDNLNLVSNVAVITVMVNWVNSAPFAVDDVINTNEDSPVSFNIVANDYDLDGTVSVTSVDLDLKTAGRQTTYTVSGEGTYTADNSGNITFTPVLNFNGLCTPKGYTISDNLGAVSDSALILITVASVNDAPVAQTDLISSPSNTNVVFSIISNDTDVDGTIDPASVDLNPSFAGIQKTYTVSGQGTYTVDNSGIVTFVPVLAFVGPVTATPVNYTVNDNSGATSNSASITITLADPSGPQTVSDAATMNEDGAPVTIDITVNDIAGSGNINLASIDLDPSTAGQQTTFTTSLGSFSVNTSTGIVTFTPALNANGSTSASYIVYDDNATPIISNITTITITINPVNDIPSFTKGGNQTSCDNTGAQIMANWATAISAGPVNESAQNLTFLVTNNSNSLFSVQPAIDVSGSLSYTPAQGQSGTATVSVKIQDDGGTVNGGVDMSAIQTFTITVNTQTAPVMGAVTQPTCGSVTGSVDISGLPSSGIWTLTPSSGSPATGTGATYTFTGLTALSTYNFTVTKAGGCTSGSSSDVIFNAIPTAPAQPAISGTTQPTCGTPSGTITFNSQMGVQYSVGSGYQAGILFSSLTPGTYTLTVRNSADHTCTTAAASTVTINNIPSAPSAPTVSSITQPTCGAPSGTLVFNNQAGVEFSVGSGYQAGTSFSALTPGIYTLTVRSVADNTCVAAAGSTSTITAVPPPPSAPSASASQTFCSGINPKISDIVITGTSIIWYDAASAGNVVASNTTLVNGTSYYASQTASGCESSSRTAVAVTVLACTGPNIVDQMVSINENLANTTSIYNVNDVNGTDKDVDGNTLTYSMISGNALGAFTINASTGAITVADGTKLDYETNPSFSLVVRASNGTLTDDATITINLNNLNDNNPVAVGDSYSVNEGGTLSVSAPGILSNDYDADGNILTSIKVTDPAHGTLTLNADGSFVYTHDGGETTTDAFTYKTNDGTHDGNTVTVSITINPVNDPPLVSDITKNVNEDNTVTFAAVDFTSSYTDPESSPLAKIRITSLPANGTLKLSGVNVNINDEILIANTVNLSFIPNINWNGSTSFGWKGYDGTVYATIAANVNITVNAVNDPPVVTDISKTINEDNVLTFVTLDFTDVFTDVDGNSLSKIKTTSLPANGTLKLLGVIVNLNDEISVASLGNLTFVPNTNWNGNTSFSWNGYDGTVYATSSANVNITVNAVNDPPIVNDISKSVNEDNTLTFAAADFTGEFSDVDGNSLTKIKITSLPANGTLKLSGINVNLNDEILVANLGLLRFTPDANWNGGTSFGWNGFDGTVYASSAANVDITVDTVNDSPVVSDISKTINEDNTLTFAALDFTSSFSDVDGNSLSKIKIASLPSNGTLKLSGVNVNINDEIAFASLGNLTFVPDANWNGATSFGWNGFDGTVYAVLDANVLITINPVNDAPTVSDIYKSALTNVTITFVAGEFTGAYADAENNALTKIKVMSLPATGTLKLSGVAVLAGNEIIVANLGNLTFVPNIGYNGTTSFIWNGNDGSVYAVSNADVNINISATPNTPPVLSNISKSGNEDQIITFTTADFTGAYIDAESNAMTKIQVASLPANATLKLSGVTVNINDEILVASLGNLTFIPDADWNGSTSFTWNGFDGTVYANSDATVNITVNAVNYPPVVSNITKNVNEDNTLTFAAIDFTSAYTDIDGNSLIKIKITSLPANGTLKLSGFNVNLNDEVLIANLGNLTFIPDANWNGNTSFKWNGNDGTVYASAYANVNITVIAVDDPPVVADIAKTINEDNTLTFAIVDFTDVFTDIDGNSMTRIKVTSLPANGVLKLSGINVAINDEILAANLGNLTFVPDNDWNGSTTFKWNAFDGTAYANSDANVNITVIAVNDPPVVSNIYKSALTSTTVTFTAADFTGAYADKENGALSKIKIIALPLNGTLKLSGVSVNADDEISAANLANLTFDPTVGWNGSASFAWNGFDGNAYALADADVDITISATPNTPPTVSDVTKSVNEDNSLTFAPSDFITAFSDAESNAIVKIKVTSLPANGTLKLSGIDVNINDEIPIANAGNLTFMPDANWNGNTSFGWNGFDGFVYANSSANVTITVNAANDPPVIVDFAKSINENNTLAFVPADFASVFSDIDGNAMTKIMVTGLPLNGTLKLSGIVVNINDEIVAANLVNLTFYPDVNWNGNTSFSWNGFDGTIYAASDAHVNITVNSVNNPPTLGIITKTVNEDNTLTFASSDFTGAFADADGNSLVKIKITSLPAHGTLKLSGVDVNINDEILVGDFDNLTFIPDANWNGGSSFGWNGFDGTVYASSDANVNITVNAVNDPPTVSTVYKSALTNTAVAFVVSDFTSVYTDIENNALTKIRIVTLPLDGTLQLSGIDVSQNDEIPLASLGSLAFVPYAGWSGSTSFGWNGFDGTAYANSAANVNITVLPNQPPVVSNVTKSLNEDNILTFAIADFTGGYADTDGDQLVKLKITSLPVNGTLKLSGVNVGMNDEIPVTLLGNLTFVPNTNWNGNTSFGWNGFDGITYAFVDANLNITVNAVNDVPVINTSPITQTINEDGGSATLDVPSNTTNTDVDVLTTSIVKNPAHGIVVVDGAGKLVYTPNANFNGVDTITYQVCDNGAPPLCATGLAIVSVSPVNDPPGLVSVLLTQTIPANGGAKTIDLPGNIVNVDGDVLTTSIMINPKHGAANINGSGQLVYTPDANFVGNDTITYQVCDDGTPQLCIAGTIVVTVTSVTPANHAPFVDNLVKTIAQDQTLSFAGIDFTSKYVDTDKDTLVSIRFVTLPSHGTLQLNGVNVTVNQDIPLADLNKLLFVSEQGYFGEATFSWEASDGKDYSATSASITITITQADVFIPEGFSPNGDGYNDYFIIKGADKYVVSLKIYNRWGNMVYESKHYQNNWDGFSNSGLVLGTKLPDGTYYYIIDFNNGEKEKIGYITINR